MLKNVTEAVSISSVKKVGIERLLQTIETELRMGLVNES